ncbi:hypothetical protein BKH29_08465 [Actinomyces oris]|uniref:Uncharacterized protein n=2 Tax=Actinomyces TaxID=1654 RepID=A0A1Q8V7A8_9ACTO|nr:hypothetical protein HMPREF9057_01679 [Actinomyces sp. oral taxon 171 str. F0337]OLO43976.1 hypothetical protein BKH29_08465 [Actinomyces oris]QCT33947.1 hypothetical protein FBF36_11190 [Actinomyces sp. oral taxon 171 str. F0337]
MLAVAASVSLALSIASCNISAYGQEPALTSLSSQSVEDLKQGVSAQELHDASLRKLTTKTGKLFISTNYSTGTATKKPDADVTRIVSRDPSTDQFQWAVSITPSAADRQMPNSISDSEYEHDRTASQSHDGDMIVSPDGRYLSLVLTPDESQRGVPATDRHTHVVVLDTQTGKAVRTAEVPGIILGQALTNSALAVETAQNYFPAGSGKGTIRVFSITSSDAQPSSFSTDQWLIGASGKDLILAPDLPPYECTSYCAPYTVTRRDTDGNTIDTLPGVTAVHPGGWVSQYRDPKAAASLVHTMHASPAKDGSTLESIRNLQEQLVHIDTGQTTDITNMFVDERSVPNGLGLVVYQDVTTGNGSMERKPAFWLSAADDGHRHTENLEQFENS